jgi:hypothetical protein
MTLDAVLQGQSPKGVPKSSSEDLHALQLCGIVPQDYNLQRLPGAKFFKPLPQLVALVAAGSRYPPVTKQDISKGFPASSWNAIPGQVGTPANTNSSNSGKKASPAGRPGCHVS